MITEHDFTIREHNPRYQRLSPACTLKVSFDVETLGVLVPELERAIDKAHPDYVVGPMVYLHINNSRLCIFVGDDNGHHEALELHWDEHQCRWLPGR